MFIKRITILLVLIAVVLSVFNPKAFAQSAIRTNIINKNKLKYNPYSFNVYGDELDLDTTLSLKDLSDKITDRDTFAKSSFNCGTVESPCGSLNLVRDKFKPLFDNKYNDRLADRLNIVFVFIGAEYSNTPFENKEQLKKFIQEDSVLNINSNEFFWGDKYGFFSIEPFKSNKDKFNFWYYEDKDQFLGFEPDKIGKQFQFYDNDLGFSYLSPVILYTNSSIRQNARLANVTFDFANPNNIITNYYPSYSRQIFMPQSGTPINKYITLVHEFGHSLFGLSDEYPETRQNDPTPIYSLPNCTLYKGQADLIWGDKIGQIDPFAYEVKNYLLGINNPFGRDLDEFRTSFVNQGCRSTEIAEQYIPSKSSLISFTGRSPIFGSHNRFIVESILNLFSGTRNILPKPSKGYAHFESYNSIIGFDSLYEPICTKYILNNRKYVDCNFAMDNEYKQYYDYRNENTTILLNIFTYDSGEVTGTCNIGFGNLTCSRMDITNISESSFPFYNLIVNGYFVELEGLKKLNQLNTINFDSQLFSMSPSKESYDRIRSNQLLFKPKDFNKDGVDDIMWWNESTGEVHIWIMKNGLKSNTTYILPPLKKSNGYEISALGDFDGDGDGDLMWRKNDGRTFIWLLENGQIQATVDLDNVSFNSSWFISAVGNFGEMTNLGNELDRTDDILWRNSETGENHIWIIKNGTKNRTGFSDNVRIDNGWEIKSVCNFNQGKQDQITWVNEKTREFHVWIMDKNGEHYSTVRNENLGLNWDLKKCVDLDGDNFDDIVFQERNDGRLHVWKYELFSKVDGYNIPTLPQNSYIEQAGNYTERGGLFIRNRVSGTSHVWRFDRNGRFSNLVANDVVSFSTGWKAETIVPLLKG